jgi:hypothetical protein
VDNKNNIIASDIQAENKNNGSAISCALPFVKGFVTFVTCLLSKMCLTLLASYAISSFACFLWKKIISIFARAKY